jgi:hypothetical protein
MPFENKSYLWKAIDQWENEGGAPRGAEQPGTLSSVSWDAMPHPSPDRALERDSRPRVR